MNIEEIEIGTNETLFLIGGGHNVLKYFSEKSDIPETSIKNFYSNLKRRQNFCDKNEIIYKNFIFPDKLYVYKDLLSHDIKSLYLNAYEKSEYNVTDVKNTYLDSVIVNVENAFYKTDTHLALTGNQAVTIAIVEDLFPEFIEKFKIEIKENTKRKENFSGDLGIKFNPPKVENIMVYKKPSSVVMADNGLANGNDGIMVLVKNDNAISEKTLMIFGDSFFRAILPQLSFFYKKIIFCRSRYFHSEIIKGFQPDHIFTGIAERYFSRCFHDSQRPHFFTYSLVKAKTQSPDEEFSKLFSEFYQLYKR
jgi:hypothetical protein